MRRAFGTGSEYKGTLRIEVWATSGAISRHSLRHEHTFKKRLFFGAMIGVPGDEAIPERTLYDLDDRQC